jgi:hypothetical protein
MGNKSEKMVRGSFDNLSCTTTAPSSTDPTQNDNSINDVGSSHSKRKESLKDNRASSVNSNSGENFERRRTFSAESVLLSRKENELQNLLIEKETGKSAIH